MSDAMLSVENLSAWYGAARILYDLNFEVGRGEVVALMGRNGAGKSTALKTIMGLMAQRQGTVRFNGDDISALKPFEIARRGLGFTPEDRRIFVDLTVMENLDIGRQPPRPFPDGRPAPSWTPEKLFSLFPNLAEMPNRLGNRMSGAMLSVENLSAWYGAARILYDLNFEVGRGEVVALMGRNGAGKSTALKPLWA